MPMIDSERTNIVPLSLWGLCAFLILARAACITYDCYVVPPPVNLVTWQMPEPINADYTNLLEPPTLLYFADSTDVVDKIKCQLFESTILKNREVAKAMKNNFKCVKVELSGKQSKVNQALAKRMGVTSTPEILAALPNGQVIGTSQLQLTDRLFVSALDDALSRRYKAAGDVFMGRADFANARAAYKKYLTCHGMSSDSIAYAEIRYYIACKSLGLNSEAEQILAKHPKVQESDSEPMPCLDYLRGSITADQLWSTYGRDYNPTTAKYVIGMKQLFDGNKPESVKSLLWVAQRATRGNADFKNARAQLRILGAEVPPEPEEDPSDRFGSQSASYEY